MKTTLKIRQEEYEGPFNLINTIRSGQTSQPAWFYRDNYFRELVNIEGKPCLVKISQRSCKKDSTLDIVAECPEKLEEDVIKARIMEIFGLNDDLDDLYEYLRSDPLLEPTIKFCRGLRLFKAHNVFECLISSISSANCSIIRWNKAIKDIKMKWGDEYKFPSGTFYTFPKPEILANVPEHDLEEMQRCEENLPENFEFTNNLKSCGVGYRAKYIIKAAKMVQTEIELEKLGNMNYKTAFNTLLKIPGVGPKVADCILCYGYGYGKAFPVDVWIGRIVSELYFNRKEIKPQKVRQFGIEKFGEHAGYVQLYLFHYARKAGLLDSLKK